MVYSNIDFIHIEDVILGIEKNIIDDCHTYGLLNKNICTDFKRIFYFYIIKEICKLQCLSTKKNIYMFDIKPRCRYELYSYMEHQKLEKFILSCIKKIKQILPINICIEECNDVTQLRYGDLKEIIHKSCKDVSNYTFRDIKKFVDKYQLTFFNKGYFDNVRIKSQIYK